MRSRRFTGACFVSLCLFLGASSSARSAATTTAISPQALASEIAAEVVADEMDGPPVDDNWWYGFDIIHGPNSRVLALCEYNGSLVAGGSFSSISGKRTGSLAMWDGESWHSWAPPGWTSTTALTVFENRLIVGGVSVLRGPPWQNMGQVLGDAFEVSKLVVASDTLYALYDNSIRRWSESSGLWSLVPGIGYVTEIAVHNGRLVAGGNFTIGLSRNIAIRNGNTWLGLSTGVGGTSEVTDLISFGGRLFVSGVFELAGGLLVNDLAAWDGQSWTPLPGGRHSKFTVHGDSLFALGQSGHVEKWNESGWISIPWNTDPSEVPLAKVLASIGGKLTIAGEYPRINNQPFYDVATLGLNGWTRLSPLIGQGLNGSVTAATVFLDTLRVAGSFTRGGAKKVRGIATWSGYDWFEFDSQLPDVSCLEVINGTLLAGGRFGVVGGLTLNNIARWTGSLWEPIGSGIIAFDEEGQPFSTLRVTAICSFGDSIVAGTDWGVALWNGLEWRWLSGGGGRYSSWKTKSLAVHEGMLYVTYRDDEDTTYFEKLRFWNGVTWNQVGEAIGANVVASFEGSLIASGVYFENVGMAVGRWNGSYWLDLQGPGGLATTMHLGRLAIGNGLWNGEGWELLGSGVQPYATEMVSHNGMLYLAGSVLTAGGKRSFNIARWDHWVSDVGPSDVGQTLWVSGGVDGKDVRVEYSLLENAVVHLFVVDVVGRIVSDIYTGAKTAGMHRAAWNRTDKNYRRVARGVYFVVLRSNGETTSQKVVILK